MNPGEPRQPVVQVGRADRRDAGTAGRDRPSCEDRRADVEDGGRRGDALAVDRDGLGAGEPQLIDHAPEVGRAHEVVGLGRARGHRLGRVVELEHDAGPAQRDEAGGHPRLLEVVVELADGRRGALPGALDLADLRPQREDLGLQAVLGRLELRRRVDERRPLLGRVADARALRRELGGDQEPEAEHRGPEGQLPARDAPDSRRDRHVALPRRQRASRTPATMSTPRQDDDRRDGTCRARRRGGLDGRRGRRCGSGRDQGVGRRCARRRRGLAARRRRRQRAVHPAGSGPAGAGCGPDLDGGLASLSASQRIREAGHRRPWRPVNASSSVRPSA